MAKEKYLKLNLGCGFRHFDGWLNVDRQELCDPDMQVDLEECPWPWDDDSVSDVRLINSLEHMGQDLQTFTSIMKELYRVCRHGAHVHIVSAYPRHDNFVNDPSACRAVTVGAMQYFDKNINEMWKKSGASNTLLALYNDVDFRVVNFKLALDEKFTKLAVARKWNNADVKNNIDLYNNSIVFSEIHLIVVKDPDDKGRFALAAPFNIPSYIMAVHPDLNLDREVSGSIAARGQWQPARSTIFTKIVRKMAEGRKRLNVMVAGANIGWYPLLAAKSSENVYVDCYEPMHDNAELLRRNIDLNLLGERITVQESALSNEQGSVKLYVDKQNLAMSSLAKYKDELEAQDVQCDSLENVFKGRQLARLPEVFMVDVQGCEQKIFEGAQKIFDRGWRPVVFAEVYPSKLAAFESKPDFVVKLEELKYQIYAVSAKGLNLSAVDSAQVAKFYQEMVKPKNKDRYMSLLCVPEDVDIKALIA